MTDLSRFTREYRLVARDLDRRLSSTDHAGARYLLLRRYAIQAARLTADLVAADPSPRWDGIRERVKLCNPSFNNATAWGCWRFVVSCLSRQHPTRMSPDAPEYDGILPFRGKVKNPTLEQIALWAHNTIDACRLLADLATETGPAGAATESETAAIAQLDRETPQLNKTNGQWVKSTLAAKLEGLETASLADYRQRGLRDDGQTLGRDKDGRVWRRAGSRNAHPWYLRSTLKTMNTGPCGKNRV